MIKQQALFETEHIKLSEIDSNRMRRIDYEDILFARMLFDADDAEIGQINEDACKIISMNKVQSCNDISLHIGEDSNCYYDNYKEAVAMYLYGEMLKARKGIRANVINHLQAPINNSKVALRN